MRIDIDAATERIPGYIDYFRGEIIRSWKRKGGSCTWKGRKFSSQQKARKAITAWVKDLDGHYWPYN